MGTNDAEPHLAPPDPGRVAARALAMSLVTCRGFIEQDASAAVAFWDRARHWFGSLGLDQELEEWERRVIETPLGKLSSADHANSQWLCEGLSVLAWALNRRERPVYDEPVVAAEVSKSLGFLVPDTVASSPTLRDSAEVEAFANSVFTVHWRLRDFSLRAEPMDLRAFATTAWFGPLSLDGVRLVDDDLAIGQWPISKAPAQDLQRCLSISQERHRAANWLLGESEIYSETDTST